MPGFNGTGPTGMGPRTGGGRGFCSQGAGPDYVNHGAGRGGIPWGGGRAWGRGRSRRWCGPAGYYSFGLPPYRAYQPYNEPAVDQEMEFLRNQSSLLELELEQIRKRLDELSGEGDTAK